MDDSLSCQRPPAASPGRDSDARRAWLIDTLRTVSRAFDGPIDDETPLDEEGVGLDSLALLRLIERLEAHTGIVISEDEITEAHFGTIGRLLRFLADRAPAG